MNPTILNREFQHPADAWYQIEAKGSHPNRAAGLVQVIDDEAAQSIVNRFNADAQAGTLRHGSEMLIDHEHFSDQADKESRAYGWATKLENRADGIYAQIRWTKTGKEAVDGGDYRFFSTEYSPADLKAVNKEAKTVRPMRLDGLTLTNMHNNRGQKPITNRQSTIGNRQSSPSPGASPEAQPTPTNTHMKQLAAELGLAPEAADEAVLAEVRKLKNRVTAAEGNLATATTERNTIKNRATALEAEVTQHREQLADADLAPVKDVLKPEELAPIRAQLVTNRAAALPLVLLTVAKATAHAADPQKELLNRDAKAPEPKSADKPKSSADHWNATK